MPDDDATDDPIWDIRHPNKENAEILRARLLDVVVTSRQCTYKEMIDGAGLQTSPATLSRYANGHLDWKKFGGHNHKAIVDFLQREGYWYNRRYISSIQSVPDHLYHSIVSYFSIRSGTEDNVRRQTRGLYRVYTPSLTIPGGIIVGMSTIFHDDDSQAMKVKETYSYRENVDGKALSLRTLVDSFEGYIFRKSKKYFFFMKDSSSSSLRIVIIPSPFRQSVEITTMTGMVLGTIHNRAYTSRIFYERFDGTEDELQEQCNIYPESDIPTPVMACFEEREARFSKIF